MLLRSTNASDYDDGAIEGAIDGAGKDDVDVNGDLCSDGDEILIAVFSKFN